MKCYFYKHIFTFCWFRSCHRPRGESTSCLVSSLHGLWISKSTIVFFILYCLHFARMMKSHWHSAWKKKEPTEIVLECVQCKQTAVCCCANCFILFFLIFFCSLFRLFLDETNCIRHRVQIVLTSCSAKSKR